MTKEIINKIVKQIKENKWIHYLIIIIIGIILSIPLSQIQIRDSHDGSLHILRFIGTVDTLKIGQFPPLINQNFCNSSGYAMNLFYPLLVTYIPLLIKLFTPTYMLALKIFGAICIIASGITMYQFVYQVTNKRAIALFSAIFYLVAPYKLANVYKRFAIGEFTAMVFIPLVFLGLYNLFNQDKKKHYYIAIGAIGMMLSHTVTTLYTSIFCIIYILFNIKKLKDIEIMKKCFINGIFILLVTMLFWLPLSEASIMADYGILDNEIMKTNGNFASENTINFYQLFKNKEEENGTIFLLGMPTIIVIVLTVFVANKVDTKYKEYYLLNIIFALISIFMTSMFFPWKIMPDLFCKLQYPWRMVGFFVFFISFICGVNVYYVLKRLIKKDILRLIITLILVIITIISSIRIMSQFYAKNKEKDRIYETSILNNKKISHKQINRDYMPTKAIYLQNTYVMEREDRTYILDGNANIIEENKKDLKDEIKIKNLQANTVLEFPYYYYPGYEITLITNENTQKIRAVESKNGYLSCSILEDIKEDGAIIKVEYVGTIITYISYTISAISLIAFIAYIIYEQKKGEKND